MVTHEMLMARQHWDFGLKIQHSKKTIKAWIKSWEGMVYVSFSGGKDSTVLMHLVQEVLKDPDMRKYRSKVSFVWVDTLKENRSVRKFVKTFDNIITLRPKQTPKQVVEKYGYPIINKGQADTLERLMRPDSEMSEKRRTKLMDGDEKGTAGKLSECYKYLLDAPFLISQKCCDILKKEPFHRYEKETGRKSFTGEMAEDSLWRTKRYKEQGCNAFNRKRPKSMPMGFWTEQDVLRYVVEFKLPIAKTYGDVIKNDEGNWETTGASRTGCEMCGFGLKYDPDRFIRFAKESPQMFHQALYNEGWKRVLDLIGARYIDTIPRNLKTMKMFDRQYTEVEEYNLR